MFLVLLLLLKPDRTLFELQKHSSLTAAKSTYLFFFSAGLKSSGTVRALVVNHTISHRPAR